MTWFARRCQEDGYVFDSAKELEHYRCLRLRQMAGDIRDLEVHVPFELAPGVILGRRRSPPIRYVADFTYRDGADGSLVVEDVKPSGTRGERGYRTAVYVLKRHLMKSVHGIEVQEVEG